MLKSSAQKPVKILIVDDEPQIQKLLSYGLSDSGWTLLKALSGEEALKIVATENPSCVLLDVGLPKMSGIEALKEIRSFSTLPVIMLTVEDEDDLKVEALELGADDYVTKPFAMPVLKARIHAVMRRHSQSSGEQNNANSTFQSAHLKIDFSSHKVFVDGKEVHLTVTEFELIELFIQNRGKVLTHQAILAKVWGEQAGDQMHYLRVYVNNLRRKIELNPSIPKLIITEPGVGYRFEA
ncbi:MAG: response regulator transcription factor [Proteobacteria bacterium]|nr:response regulator transcription factor [Pseudomonadota bacterium]